MYLTVKQVAYRLGVSPMTIRRWTESGFLACRRTAGGHRRIAVEDVDDLVRHIGGSSPATARRARGLEIESLVQMSVALTSQLALGDLVVEIARQMIALTDCDACAVEEYDRAAHRVVILAEYDRTGRPVRGMTSYNLHEFPLTRKVLDEQVTAVVNVDDPHADASEVAALRLTHDRSLLMLPLVYRAETIGLLELSDYVRSRKYDHAQLRLCRAIADQIAVALRNAHAFTEAQRSDADSARLRDALRHATVVPRIAELPGGDGDALRAVAQLACGTLDEILRVLETGTAVAGASGATARPAASTPE